MKVDEAEEDPEREAHPSKRVEDGLGIVTLNVPPSIEEGDAAYEDEKKSGEVCPPEMREVKSARGAVSNCANFCGSVGGFFIGVWRGRRDFFLRRGNESHNGGGCLLLVLVSMLPDAVMAEEFFIQGHRAKFAKLHGPILFSLYFTVPLGRPRRLVRPGRIRVRGECRHGVGRLEVDGMTIRIQGGLMDRFSQCRVSVDRGMDIIYGGL